MKKKNSESFDSFSSSEESIDDEEKSSDEEIDDTKNKKFILANFSPKEKCYYKMINDYFRDKENCSDDDINKMVLMIKTEKKKIDKTDKIDKNDKYTKQISVSLRLLDWLVTKYSRNTKIIIKDLNGEKQDLRTCYKSMLNTYKKRYFDPFKRKNKGFKVFTTLGQLNFFKWAISNGIIKYVEDNKVFLCKEMKKFNLDEKKKKEEKKKNDISSSSESKKTNQKKISKNILNGIKNGNLEITWD